MERKMEKKKIKLASWDKVIETYMGIEIKSNSIIDYLFPPITEDILTILFTNWDDKDGVTIALFIDTRTAFHLYDGIESTKCLEVYTKPKDKAVKKQHEKHLKEVKDALRDINTWYKETTQKIYKVAYEPNVSTRRTIQDGLRKTINKRIKAFGY